MTGPLTIQLVTEAGYDGDIPLLERAERDSDPILRTAALGSFHRLGLLNRERLRRAFADDDPLVRRRAVELTPRVTDRRVLVDDLVRLLADDATVAEMAAFALGEVGEADDAPTPLSPAAVGELEAMARNHGDALCREAAVAALGSARAGLDSILAAFDDKATVRRRAVVALAPFDGPAVDAALERALTDRDWQVRQAAEDLTEPEV